MSADFTPTARIVADSISPAGHRLTTIEASFHRFVLPEFNTHRALARNSASSRAIPVHRTVTRITDNPALPLRWPAEQRGMQGGIDIDDPAKARDTWLAARDDAIRHAEQLATLGVHKSVVNRLLEPFMPHTVIVSATTWDGFWRQRCSPLAQDEIRLAADAMRAAVENSVPSEVPVGCWHLPYIDASDRAELPPSWLRRISVARCARVSYLTHDGRRDPEADLALFDRLIEADPPHASPLEHVASPLPSGSNLHRGNFVGWRQLRHVVLGS